MRASDEHTLRALLLASLSKITNAASKCTEQVIKDMQDFGPLAELDVLRKALNERAKVEQEMWNYIKHGKAADALTLKDWACRLGIPEEYRVIQTTDELHRWNPSIRYHVGQKLLLPGGLEVLITGENK
jgi:hypothetical protein